MGSHIIRVGNVEIMSLSDGMLEFDVVDVKGPEVICKVVRGGVLIAKEEAYVEAARGLGYSPWRIALRHIAPNVLGPAIVYATLQTGRNVILAASLSFLGLGPQPPTPDWGQMLSGGRTALAIAAHVSTIPGLAIVALAIGFNLLGDSARDLLDPRMKRDQP